MITWQEAVVSHIRRGWGRSIECDVTTADGTILRALAYADLVGEPIVGDRVLLNTSALDRGLGTGGLALIVALPDRFPAPPAPEPGHVVKARYTPLQTMVLGVDEQESPSHALLAEADSLDGMPVVAADLHSAVPAIIAGLLPNGADRPSLRVAYVMTDGGALPAGFSRTIHGLREAGWIVGTVTVGQAFGGDLEAVNVHTGLLAARLVLGADLAIVAQGPGNLGTGTRWGFSGTSAGEALNAAHTLGGRAIASLRVSQADPRERHRGISHHSVTAYTRVALVPAELPVPVFGGDFGNRVTDQADAMVQASLGRLARCDIPVDGLVEALRRSPVALSTMGRGLDADRASFVAAAAAGRHVQALLDQA